MTNSFKLSELSENTLVGRDIGKKTRQHIEDLILKHENIIIDMEDNKSISPSFLDEAIIALVLQYGKVEFSKKIKLFNLNNGIKSMMNSILHDKVQKQNAKELKDK